ncbi:hypothetical protein ACBQ54_17175 [Providencia vermicola]|uniref:hypothetical protein n=1 Tax=Providencia vermicola TaxID=333965 RepID=UPI003524F07E
MDILKTTYIPEARVTLFDLKLSEGEITIYADCIQYVLSKCPDDDISQVTDCENKEELSYYLENLKNLMKSMEHRRYLPDRYKDL